MSRKRILRLIPYILGAASNATTLGPVGWRMAQKTQTSRNERRLATAIAFTATILCGTASLQLAARADTLTATAVTDVVFGADNILTIQTGVPSSFNFQTDPSGPITSVDYELPNSIAQAAGQSFAAQLAADQAAVTGHVSNCFDSSGTPSTSCASIQAIPSFVLTAISNSVSVNILGNSSIPGFDPSIFVPVDTDYDFTYVFTDTVPPGPYEGDQLSIFDNFQFFQATPIPTTLPLFASGLGAIGLLGWCRMKQTATCAARQ